MSTLKEEKELVFRLRAGQSHPIAGTKTWAWGHITFIPYVGEDGRPEWKAHELDVTLKHHGKQGWVILSADGKVLMRPWDHEPLNDVLRPPEGVWMALYEGRAGSSAHIYDVEALSVFR